MTTPGTTQEQVGLQAHAFELDAVFDTNAIRSIGQLPMHEFRALRRLARSAGLKTAWLEETFGELMVTNLNRKEGCTDAALLEIQTAMSRFDQLAHGVLCRGVNTLVRGCIYNLAQAPAPDPDPDDRRRDWRVIIDGFLRLRSAEDIKFGKDTDVYSQFRLRNTGEMCRVNVPSAFVPFAEVKIASWRERLISEGRLNVLEKDAAILEDWERWAVATGDQLGIPREIIKRAFWVEAEGRLTRRPADDVLNTPFAWRIVPWNVYAAWRVSGKKSRVKENDGRDIALSTYLSVAGRLVTDDHDLLVLLREIVGDKRRIVSLDEFRTLLRAQAAADVEPYQHPAGS